MPPRAHTMNTRIAIKPMIPQAIRTTGSSFLVKRHDATVFTRSVLRPD